MLTNNQKIELRQLQRDYNRIKKEIEYIKEISRINELKVLNKNVFLDDDCERVTDYSYMIKDDQMIEFLKLHFIENKKSGLPVINYDLVIEYPKEQELKNIEKRLFELQILTIPQNLKDSIKKAQQHYKFKDEALDLILRLQV